MSIVENIFEAELGSNGGKISFKTHDEIQNFINKEYAFWQWLQQPPANGHSPSNYAWQAIANNYQQLIQSLQGWRSQPSYEHNFRIYFDKYFKEQSIPISTGKNGIFINQLRERRGDIVASSALSALIGSHQQLGQYPYILGAVEMAAFDMGVNSKTAEASQKALDDLLGKLSESHNRAVKSGDELTTKIIQITDNQTASFKESSAYAKRLSKVMGCWTAHRIKMHKRIKDAEIAKSIEEFKAVEATYKEAMKLKAPATYWTDKSNDHQKAADKLFDRLLWIVKLGVPIIIGMLMSAIWYGQNEIDGDTPYAVLGLYGAIGIFVTTVVFWMARLTLKMYLSERHLATDAKERETMALTYLALTNDGKAEKEERSLVLAALFRSSSDGIVKDDAAPDFGLATILSKAMSKN